MLYRARWQIELLFKLWKSHNRLETHRAAASAVEQLATDLREVDRRAFATLDPPDGDLVRLPTQPDEGRERSSRDWVTLLCADPPYEFGPFLSPDVMSLSFSHFSTGMNCLEVASYDRTSPVSIMKTQP